MATPCKYEKEIAVMGDRIKAIYKTLHGNGTKGLLKKVDELLIEKAKDNERHKIEGKIETWSRKKLFFWGGAILIIIQFIFTLMMEVMKDKMFP